MSNRRSHTPRLVVACCSLLFAATAVQGQALNASKSTRFLYRNGQDGTHSVSVVTKYYSKKIVHPLAKIDRRLDPKLMAAASLAQERSHAKSRERCWHYVKEALLASGAVNSYPKTAYAKQAGEELVHAYGFRKLPMRDPYAAPVGSVLVYSNRGYAGHVEIRTKDGFVSDYRSKTACQYPLIAVYGKLL